MLDAIPASRQEAVRAALQAAFATTAVDALEKMSLGMSTALVYRIVVESRPYLLRIVTQVNALNNPARHFACLKIAAEAGLAPAVHHADPDQALVITDYIAARPLALFDKPRADLFADLAAAVRCLQAAATFPPFMNYLDGIDMLIADVRASELLPEAASEVFERFAAIPGAYPRDPADLVSSHNDLNPTNILWDGERLWIVDWEAAFLNDRYVDPAQVCNYFAATPQEETAFLTTWLGSAPGEHQRARLFLMRQVCQMFFATILLEMAATARHGWRLPPDTFASAPPLADLRRHLLDLLRSPEGQAQVGVAALNDVLTNLRTPQFPEALRMTTRR